MPVVRVYAASVSLMTAVTAVRTFLSRDRRAEPGLLILSLMPLIMGLGSLSWRN